ncbi:MAG: hypothetical protein IKU36_07095 [Bacteroidales bacterium]|nr:hypothetical protein [Bacteroidales bacterium]
MNTEQKMELCLKLLEITAESRFAIMKDIWNLQVRIRPLSHNHYRDAISNAITKLREDIFETLVSAGAFSSDALIMEIASCSDLPQVKKNIAALAITGMSDECIAALNCVDKGYVRIYIRTLKEDFPEIFAEI